MPSTQGKKNILGTNISFNPVIVGFVVVKIPTHGFQILCNYRKTSHCSNKSPHFSNGRDPP